MVTQAVKTRRVRVTRQDIEKAREELSKQPKPIKPKAEGEKPRHKKDFWYGLVYCDSYGHAWIDNFKSVYLGKTDELIPYLKSKRIDGENVDMVLQAAKEFQSEFESHSCHLATRNRITPIRVPSEKPIVATFKKNPQFLRLLERLISQGKGIRVIHSELKGKGYRVPTRTLGRWIKRYRDAV